MKTVATVIGALLLGTLSGIASAADEGSVYVWKDKDGTPHFQDRPPEGDVSAAKEMNLRYKLTDEQAIAAAKEQTAEQKAARGVREKQDAEEADAAKADKEKLLNEREKGCATARERLEQYDTAHRLYRPGPDGQRIYLSDEEIDAARAEARRTVTEWCGG